MARIEADLTAIMLVSDYDPAHYYNWDENELPALRAGCKAIAEVVKRRLEDNGTKVEEMYVIEHHNGTDETKPHYHILIKFADKQGATLKEIAKYIGVPAEVIEKPKPGGHSYHNMLAYLTHIKYENKTPYPPEAVVTLAGTDYMVHYNKHKESWINARAIVAKKGGKPLKSLLREALAKMETGEIAYDELRGIEKYRRLRLDAKCQKELEKKRDCVKSLAFDDYSALSESIKNGEITSLEEITTDKTWKLAYKHYKDLILSELHIPR